MLENQLLVLDCNWVTITIVSVIYSKINHIKFKILKPWNVVSDINWLSSWSYIIVDMMGKKVWHHQPHSRQLTFNLKQYSNNLLHFSGWNQTHFGQLCSFIRTTNKLTPKQCKAQQSSACWLKPCSAWQIHRWRSGADGEAAELCGPWGWLRWYCGGWMWQK